MRHYPALRIGFPTAPSQDEIDRLLAELDTHQPTAIEEGPDSVRAFFATSGARDLALGALSSSAWRDVTAEDVPDEDWAARSQAALTPVTVGRLTIAPPWTVTEVLRRDVPGPVIIIQPSMGFGTGHHASTRLCLQLMQDLELTNARVLDVGTGSGVLAIAARLLGAREVLGIDIDPDALENARENLALNGIASGVTFAESDVHNQTGTQSYDLVLANLTGAMLVREAEGLTRLAAARGRIIVSGVQVHEEAAVTTAFDAAGWRVSARGESDSWVGASFQSDL